MDVLEHKYYSGFMYPKKQNPAEAGLSLIPKTNQD